MQNNQEEIIKAIQDAVGRKEVMGQRVSAALVINKHITEKLQNLQQERKNEHNKLEILNARVGDVTSAEKHASFSLNKVKLDLRRKDAMLADFNRLVKHVSMLAADKQPMQKSQKLYNEWKALQANSPWLPDKRKLQEELLGHQRKAIQVQEQIQQYQSQIDACKELMASHQEYPFRAFCVLLANYRQKSKDMRRVMCKELETHKKLEERMRRSGVELYNNVSAGSSAGSCYNEAIDNGNQQQQKRTSQHLEMMTVTEVASKENEADEAHCNKQQKPLEIVVEHKIDEQNEDESAMDSTFNMNNLGYGGDGVDVNTNKMDGIIERTNHQLEMVVEEANEGNEDENGMDGSNFGEVVGNTQQNEDKRQPSATQNFLNYFGGNGNGGAVESSFNNLFVDGGDTSKMDGLVGIGGGGGGVDSSFNMNNLFGGDAGDTSKADGPSDFFAFMGGGNNEKKGEDDPGSGSFNFDFNFG